MGDAEQLGRVPKADADVIHEDTSCASGRCAGFGSLFLGPLPVGSTHANGSLHVRS